MSDETNGDGSGTARRNGNDPEDGNSRGRKDPVAVRTYHQARITSDGEPGGEKCRIRPYETNEDVFRDLTGLLEKIKHLNLTVLRLEMQGRERSFGEKEVSAAPQKKISQDNARRDLEMWERKVRLGIEKTGALNHPQPPFLEFCKKNDMNFHETLILSRLLHDSTEFHSRDGPLLVRDIVELFGKAYLNRVNVKEYLKKDGRLRRSGVMKLVGRKPVLTSSIIVINPEPFREIHNDDYEEDIELINAPWEEENTGTHSFPEEAPQEKLADVVLPAEIRTTITNGLLQAKHSQIFLENMGYGKSGKCGRGISMLLAGPPGTGKTMAARAVASELGRKLIVVKYSQLENKFVGETEKNIDKIFAEAKKNNAVLVFDEADAVFYVRNQNEKSWANRDVSVLLQAIEKFDGVVILTTNSGQLLDPALERRMNIKVRFPMPDLGAREAIFRKLAPTAVEPDVDYHLLASRYELSGGQIRNVWLNAGRMALGRTNGHPDTRVTMADTEAAARFEIDGGEAMKTQLDGRKPEGYA